MLIENLILAQIILLFDFLLRVPNTNATENRNLMMKIYNGSNAEGHRYLKHTVIVERSSFVCAGAILTSNAILTAGHCVVANNEIIPHTRIKICAGSFRLDCTSPKAQTSFDRKVILHRYFKWPPITHDVAIVILQKHLVEDGITVQRIPLPYKPYVDGTSCTTIGWGDTSCPINKGSPLRFPENALFTTLTLMSLRYCSRIIPMPPGRLCAADRTNNTLTCNGDSGAPLICHGHLVGVLGAGFDILGSAQFFTDVFYYRNWINKILQQTHFQMRSLSSCSKQCSWYLKCFWILFWNLKIIIK